MTAAVTGRVAGRLPAAVRVGAASRSARRWEGGEVDAGDAVGPVVQPAGQESAGDDAGNVVRHQDRHRRHRIVALDQGDRCSQGLQCGAPVGRRRYLNRHNAPLGDVFACPIAGYRLRPTKGC